VTSTRPPTPNTHPLPLHDALPISPLASSHRVCSEDDRLSSATSRDLPRPASATMRAWLPCPWWASARTSSRRCSSAARPTRGVRSEEHTSELQSRENLVCRLLLEK